MLVSGYQKSQAVLYNPHLVMRGVAFLISLCVQYTEQHTVIIANIMKEVNFGICYSRVLLKMCILDIAIDTLFEGQ